MIRYFQSHQRLHLIILLLFLLGYSSTQFADEQCNSDSIELPKNTFNIMMNDELGIHCTGFEFVYCCVLPSYNSILAQVVKIQQSGEGQDAFVQLLEGDPIEGLDELVRQTVN